MFGLILCIVSIPFLEAPLNFNPLIFFSLGYALFFSTPFLLTKFNNLAKRYKRINYSIKFLNKNNGRTQLKKFYITIAASILIVFSIFAIQSVTSQISYVSEFGGIQSLSILTVTAYLSIVSDFLIGIFAFLFYFGEAN
jgi:uncharacterized membrane protein YbaN (DUF454 family)